MLGDLLAGMFVAFAIIALTAAAFGVWLVMSAIRLIGRTVHAAFHPPAPALKWDMTRTCARPQCYASNPASARFCRRCGQALS